MCNLGRVLIISALASIPAAGTAFAAASGEYCPPPGGAFLRAGELLRQANYSQALEILTALLDELQTGPAAAASPAIPCVMDRMATALNRMGRFSTALEWSRAALERSRATEPHHPAEAVFANNVATDYLAAGDDRRAESYARQALELTSLEPGTPRAHRALALRTLAAVYTHRGDYVRAEPLLRQSLRYFGNELGPNHAEVGLTALQLAELSRVHGRFAESAALCRQAIAVLEAVSPAPTWELWIARARLMVSLEFSGRHNDASQLLAAVEAVAQSAPPEDARLATLLHCAAFVRLRRKESAPARIAIERALSILESAHGAGSPLLVPALQTYAEVLRQSKEKRLAKRADARIHTLTEPAPAR